ncbi:MAG: HAMP domain-containing protein [Planctomycetes bacterium]|nr:HAMP domain-containing protein [Planctomycetota bacterium]
MKTAKNVCDVIDAGEFLKILRNVRKGKFDTRCPIPKDGPGQAIAQTLNEIIELNERVADEFRRVSRVVGKEGKLSERVSLKGAAGEWAVTVDAANSLITDLVQPTNEVARVIGAVANGNLSQTMPTEIEGKPVRGAFLRMAKTVNTMVSQLGSFASEVTRVAREVGTEGKLGGQAQVKGVAGVWKDLTDNVNSMAGNLTSQVRNIADVTTAVAKGDLSRKITVKGEGEILQLKDTINTLVDQLNGFASEVTRVAREVGTEGKLGGQAQVTGVGGVWKDLTDNVNFMASNLTSQVRNIAEVTTAVARGDLSKKITVEVKGEILELKNTINTMVDQLNGFAGEVTRVAREVGTEGKLGGQAQVKGVGGVWKDLTDNVNSMAGNLTSQVRNIADVTTAVAKGDLSKKITVPVRGEILELKNTINVMVDQLNGFAGEVTRVAREVGTEGKLGGQAQVKGVGGVWKDLTDNVNSMAGNLTSQVRNIAEVTTAVAKGDLSKKITVEVRGEILQLKNTINTMVDQLNGFAGEVTRVAREVGTEGNLGGQADVKGVAGVWKDLTDNVNSMAGNLTSQVRNIADVTTAVAKGDLSKKITVQVKGEILRLKDTINTMVDQLNAFAGEVTRVAREVGTEGKLGGQAQVKGVGGVWKDLTDNVNFMAGNLTSQVRNIAEVTTAVAKGDLSRKITVEVRGEILRLKETINTMVDQLNAFAGEVTRVAREVGTEGKLGGQAQVRGVAGVWKDLTDNVNSMAGNLTSQVRNIADVTTAVANGDLSRKITVKGEGEILQLKETINTLVDQLNGFASEVTRVAREVGTDGKLGGQAQVKGVAGVWKELTDNVNFMASNLTSQVRNIADVTTAVAKGDLSKKIAVEVKGEILQLKDTINTMVDQLNGFASEVTRVAREVGTEGKLGGQAQVKGVAGVWKDLTDNVNFMASNLTSQVRNIADVTTAVAKGDLSRKITVLVEGEILQLKDTINTMVDQLNAFAGEVTRVAREVGTEGKLGGQAQVKGVAGVWKDLTDNVNFMASNLTTQVRRIAAVVTAVANGDLKLKITLEARGEIATLADTINNMIDTLATFADQTTTVAREVGVEGKLGGQARVPGATGIWRDLTDNVNQLAANLTGQVRAIAEVSTAVTKGDLTRSITVEARGEVENLKDKINEMIRNLRQTTQKNAEQDWLKTNLAKFTRMLQGQRDLESVARQILSELAPLVGAQHSVFYTLDEGQQVPTLNLVSGYGYTPREDLPPRFPVGQGLVGQCAQERKRIIIDEVPPAYIRISSGLGEAVPSSIVVLPVLFENQVRAVLELAAFNRFNDTHLNFLDQLTESIGIVLNTIAATMNTEALLKKSQALTQELQQTNAELEEKAEQLALTSKYKSEFLANMSHELRTPLNSLLILAKMLYENPEGNLTAKQVEFGKAIHNSGSDLLSLINDILDLSKIESGTMAVEVASVSFKDLHADTEPSFRPIAANKKLDFSIDLDASLPSSMQTDSKRLQQVLRNLLSNSFKFTSKGSVSLRVFEAKSGWSHDHPILNTAEKVIAFAVTDTGIGIPEDKQQIIFEPFQQADMTTSRKYGGTGLGLSISREIARMLGGEIRLTSKVREGSTFTLYLPVNFTPPKGRQVREAPASGGNGRPHGEEPVRAELPDNITATLLREVHDDRDNIGPDDKTILIVEDDFTFAHVLLDLAHLEGFKGLIANGGELGLQMTRKFKPHTVMMDMRMPDMDGWTLLDCLKHDPETRHIPIQIVTSDDSRERGLKCGAFSYLQKPVSRESICDALKRLKTFIDRPRKALLIVEDNDVQRQGLVELLGGPDVDTVDVGTGEAALEKLAAQPFDCVVLDLRLPDMSGFDLLAKIKENKELEQLPIIVYTGKSLTKKEDAQLRKLTGAVIIKDVNSPERLFYETALFLHRATSALPEAKRRMLQETLRMDPQLAGRKVLIVDDDIRNIFALTSVLERQRLTVEHVQNGREAVDLLTNRPKAADIVLMDIMMPEMDGYEAMRLIRQNDDLKALPIIALTAKAMKGDRERCIEAGASDYIPKPVDTEQLLSLLRVWVYEDREISVS